ncbi:dipeptidase [Nakamurella lactea]|uniref:dipeptidase n=1 Tax=Nakamurella lactea TaxID=459515 RepID=UPI0003FD45AC|nr:membrane dipeptidase [Nakamurella lactea]
MATGTLDARRAPIVNALGTLNNPNAGVAAETGGQLNQRAADLTIDARAIDDALRSGLAAVNVTIGYTAGDDDPFESTVRDLAYWDEIVRTNDELVKVYTAEDISRAHDDGRLGIIYGFQNAAMVGADASRINLFADLGVRVVQLTYNAVNKLGGGCMAPGNPGLSDLGREVIDRLNERNLMVDLSHSGERTCLDAARYSRTPISINHTGCRALVDLPRNKTDEELRAVAERGGFVGIYFMPFLNASGHATAADVVEHIAHAVDVCGIDQVGIGTDGSATPIDDLDGYLVTLADHVEARRASGAGAAGERADTVPFVKDLSGVGQFERLAGLLGDRGFGAEQIDKLLGGNFIAYAQRVWADA